MYQVTFSEQCMSEMNGLGMMEQMELMEAIGSLTPDQLAHPREPLGRFNRAGKTFYRLRAGEFRCYFEVTDTILNAQYLLHRNTLTDFIFRTKLPITEEQMIEQHSSFWKYLETLTQESDETDKTAH